MSTRLPGSHLHRQWTDRLRQPGGGTRSLHSSSSPSCFGESLDRHRPRRPRRGRAGRRRRRRGRQRHARSGIVIGAAALGASPATPPAISSVEASAPTRSRRTAGDDVCARRFDRARRHFADHGTLTFAAARWVGALRGVVPVVAGSSRVPAPRFYAPSMPSAIAWSTTVGVARVTSGATTSPTSSTGSAW